MKRRKAKSQKRRIADTIAQAVPMSGFPRSVLKWAKGQGCPAFRGGRVYIDELLPWLEKNPPQLDGKHLPQKDELQVLILLENLEAKRTQNGLFRKEYVRRAEVEKQLDGVATAIMTTLRNVLRNELPPKLEGLRAPEMVSIMEQTTSQIMRLWREIKVVNVQPDKSI